MSLQQLPGGVCAPRGFKAAGVACGIKRGDIFDLAMIYSERPATAAAVYTSNRFRAAPLLLTSEHLAAGTLRAVVANSGNANACTGERGVDDARTMAKLAGAALGCDATEVAVASTGVIGSFLPMPEITAGIEKASAALTVEGAAEAARAILTTDKSPKECAVACDLASGRVILGGMAKGAGMIRPDMATMLAFVTTDASIDAQTLRQCLRRATSVSFNMINVDGCMSTNDMVVVMANGDGPPCTGPDVEGFTEALTYVCCELARSIVRDAEGATKFVTISVKGAADAAEAKQAGMAVADSALVKTALFGQDPNWGRIAAAVGACGIEFDASLVTISIGGQLLAAAGTAAAPDEAAARLHMQGRDIDIMVDLGRGAHEAEIWTSDLSYDYVRINADYRS
ncbi:MAG: bifunctional glutamate N-acetyltransferase/amino-acid acetyltransferase ArgJ [Candidatus Geothermincolia bacterium]